MQFLLLFLSAFFVWLALCDNALLYYYLSNLPPFFSSASPLPLLVLAAHKSIDFHVADARKLLIPHNSLDLVYTRLTLEQMEQIRHQVFLEISRVTRYAAILIEACKDFNLSIPGKDYIRRMGYFSAKISSMKRYVFHIIDQPQIVHQKLQFNASPVSCCFG